MPVLSNQGVGDVRFGLPTARAVSQLDRFLGRPTRRFANTGCSPRYREVAWGRLVAEFRLGRFTGFRYLAGGWLGSARRTKATGPRLATAKGISLGSTLGQLRAAYGRLNLIGTDRWQTSDGLVFYDDAERDPPPPSSRIIEIKYGTCGDF